MSMDSRNKSGNFDVFIAHASEDNATITVPLVRQLRARGLGVWYCRINASGVSESEYSDQELAEFLTNSMNSCKFGVLILSRRFLSKRWPVFELDYWLTRPKNDRAIISILHEVAIDEVAQKIGRPARDLQRQ